MFEILPPKSALLTLTSQIRGRERCSGSIGLDSGKSLGCYLPRCAYRPLHIDRLGVGAVCFPSLPAGACNARHIAPA